MPILPSKLDVTETGQFIDITDPADPETDLSATQYNRLSAAAAAMSQTAIRAAVLIDSAGDLLESYAVWKNPSSTISSVQDNTGEFTVTFSSTVEDLQGNTQSVNLFAAFVQIIGSQPLISSVTRISGTSFKIYTNDDTGTSADKFFWVFFL